MTPTNKGNYIECKNCIFKIEEDSKYPCEYSHKVIRTGSGELLERNFKKCGLFEKVRK